MFKATLTIALHTYVLQWPIDGELGKKFQTVTLESIHCVQLNSKVSKSYRESSKK
jgi:hypothetical protein